MSVSRKAKMAHLSITNRRLERLASEQGIHIDALLRERDEARRVAAYWYQKCLEARAECTELAGEATIVVVNNHIVKEYDIYDVARWLTNHDRD